MPQSRVLTAALFSALTVLGLAGNYFRYPIFFNIDFLFGSIFSMLALQFLGWRAGVLSAFLASSITYLFWNHPYAIVVVTGEAIMVAWLHERKKIDWVIGDAVYWCVLGMPLVFLFYYGVMDLPVNNATITMFKQAINGLTNALLARTLFLALTYRNRRFEFSIRELAFNGSFMFILLPSLFLIANRSQTERDDVDLRLQGTLRSTAIKTTANLNRWLQGNIDRVAYLAQKAGKRPVGEMQMFIEQMRESNTDFLRVGLHNDKAITIAYSPLQDELGHSSLGKNYSDRPFIAQLKTVQGPFLGDVVMGRFGLPKPMTCVLAPVWTKGHYSGYVIGVLNLDKLEELLVLNAPSGALQRLNYTLIDKNSHVIVTNKPNVKSMELFKRDKGEVITMSDELIQWFPESKRNISVSAKWKDAIYISDTPVGQLSDWRLILETPVEPLQQKLFADYNALFAKLGLALLAALILARAFSNMLAQAKEASDTTNAVLKNEIALRDQAAALLLAHQQRLSYFIDGAPVGIAMFDRNMRYLAASRHFLEEYHLVDVDIIGREHYEVFPKIPQAWRDVHRRCLAGETLRGEQEAVVRADGRVRWIRWEIRPWYAGANDIGGLIMYSENITERKRHEETISQQTAELDMLYATAPIGLFFCSKDLRYLRVNNTMAEVHGLSAQAHVGKALRDVLSAALADAVEPLLRQAMLTGQPLLEQEMRGATAARSEEPRDWLVSFFPVADENGSNIGVHGVVQEVTERNRVKAELSDARMQAEQANLAKSRFLAAASHDLRQPLTALSLYLNVLESKFGPDETLVKNMSNCVASLSGLLTDLLDLSKLQAGVVQPIITDFAVSDLLERLTSAHGPQAQLKNLRLRCRTSNLTAHTDPVLYGRILDNFVANAVRYTHQGGVLVGCRRHQGKTWIEVWDTGIGIAAGKTEEIFEEFHQLDNAERGHNKGSGLGLSIAAKTAELLGLPIRMRSVPGSGSLFAIELPLGDAPARVKAVAPRVSRRLRVALVDDHAMVLDALVHVLAGAGHEVVAASCGKDLLVSLDGRAPDVVVSDFRLAHDETGFDVIHSLRAVFGDTLPAIVITGDTDPNLLRSMVDRGICVQHKPLKLDSLLVAIGGLAG